MVTLPAIAARSYGKLLEKDVRYQRRVPYQLIFAAVLCFAIFIFQIYIVAQPVYISTAHGFSTTNRNIYVTLMAVLATVLAIYIKSEVQGSLLNWVDFHLTYQHDRSPERLNGPWKAILGVQGFKESLTQVSTWPYQILFALASLITTALIAGTTPTQFPQSFSWSNFVVQGGDNSTCSGFIPKQYEELTWAGVSTLAGVWDAGEGLDYRVGLSSFGSACPASLANTYIESINTITPLGCAYTSDGVAILPSAMGVPKILFSRSFKAATQTGLQGLMQAPNFGSIASVEQCAPVLTSNPVSCRADSSGIMGVDSRINLNNALPWVSTQGCNITANSLSGEADYGVMFGGLCPGSEIGSGTVSIGASNRQAMYLALAMGDLTWANANQNWTGFQPSVWNATASYEPLKYTVTCDVNFQSAMAWREITYDIVQKDPTSEYGQTVYSKGKGCTAPGPMGWAYAATGATSLWTLLAIENSFGYPKDLIRAALQTMPSQARNSTDLSLQWTDTVARTGPFAFNNSKNGLEDILGTVGAITASKIPATNASSGLEDIYINAPDFGGPTGSGNLATLTVPATRTYNYVRIGSGVSVAYLYSLPALVTGVIAVVLLWKVSWMQAALRSTELPDMLTLGRQRSLARPTPEGLDLERWPGFVRPPPLPTEEGKAF